MKLKLPKQLLLVLLSIFTVIPCLAVDIETADLTQSDITKDTALKCTTVDKEYVFNLKESISFDGTERTEDKCFLDATQKVTFQGDKWEGYDFSMGNFSTTSDSVKAAIEGGIAREIAFFKMGNLSFVSLVTEGSAGAIYMPKGRVTFKETGNILFKDNKSSASTGYGAIATDMIYFAHTKDITFINNTANYEGGAIRATGGFNFSSIKGKITFKDNQSLDPYSHGGGACFAQGSSMIIGVNDVLFENNKAAGPGGALAMENTKFDIMFAGNVEFINNYSAHHGGAISMTLAQQMFLVADHGNITFKGNMAENRPENNHTTALLPIANALYLSGVENAYLQAAWDREIIFYDPILFKLHEDDEGTLAVLHLGEDSTMSLIYVGTVRFSGENYLSENPGLTQGETETATDFEKRLSDSRYSQVGNTITLHSGALVIEHQAILGEKPGTEISTPPIPPTPENPSGGGSDWDKIESEQEIGAFSVSSARNAKAGEAELEWDENTSSSVKLESGLLRIATGGVLVSPSVTFSGSDMIIGGDGTGRIIANTVDMSHGFSFDVVDSTIGIVIEANSITYGGTLGIADRSLDTYGDNKWAQTQKFSFISVGRVLEDGKIGTFDGIVSNTTGTNTIDSAYGYQGVWSYEWSENGNILIGTWTPLGGGITDVDPELEGNIVSNSMWSSASNAKALSNTALVNANILRFESSMKSNFWVKGIGDFAYDDSTTELDGYSYQGGGYAAGADFKLGKKSIVGVAFGQLMGDNKSELYTSQIKQDSMMGSLYAAHLQTLNKRNSLLWTLAGTYGDTENSMNTHYSDGDNSSGSWNNNAYFVEAKMEWRIAPEGKSWTYKPFIGVEYTEVKLEGFTEVGDKAREFAEGAYKNIALPIGIGFEHQSHFGKKTWLNSLSLAYVPDVYREAPNTQATRLSNGFSWKDQGSKPSIHTLRATINSTLQLNASWTAYAGYTFEAREDASYHNVNTGVSYSF